MEYQTLQPGTNSVKASNTNGKYHRPKFIHIEASERERGREKVREIKKEREGERNKEKQKSYIFQIRFNDYTTRCLIEVLWPEWLI